MIATRMTAAAVVALVAVAVVTRFAWLGADPPLFKAAAEVTDEGVWAHNARAAVIGPNVLVIAGMAGVWVLERLQGRRLARDLIACAAGFAPIVAVWVAVGYLPHATLFGLNNLALNRDRLLLQPSDLGRLPLHFLNNPFWGLPWGAIAIGVNLARPTYTQRDASAAIGALARPGDAITGGFPHQLSLGNATLPIWYTPRRAYNRLLNADLARFPIRWVLTKERYGETPRHDQFPFRLERVRDIDLYPAPRGGTKAKLTLYRRVD